MTSLPSSCPSHACFGSTTRRIAFHPPQVEYGLIDAVVSKPVLAMA